MNALKIRTLDDGQTTIEGSQIEEFKTNFRGMVLCADDAGYDASRAIWNGMFDRKPAIVARCAETRDIANAVNFARGNRLLLSVKGGGHNSAGTAA
jgi:FAD/FMN-containing dehydrogenase